MPCEYSTVNLREREAARKKQREEEQRAEIARKKSSLLIVLTSLGFDLDLKSAGLNHTMIIGSKEE